MTLSNPWFILALVATVGWFHIKLVLDFLNLHRLTKAVPEALQDTISEEDQARACEYVIAHARLDVMRDAAALAALLAFWWAGGFGWLSAQVAQATSHDIVAGLLLFGALASLSALLSLPFDLWSTFVIEESFGLNRTTLATFIGDRVKGAIIGAVLGSMMAAPVLWMFQHAQLAALWAWLFVTAFGLVMTWAAPRWLMPIFLKFTPMEDGDLKRAILALAEKLQFPVRDLYIVDGSRRSAKANAFFTGVGSNRRIALYDTLLEKHEQPEIVSVLAHEIGHAKLGHVPRMFLVAMAQSALLFAALHFALLEPGLFAAFQAGPPQVAMGLVLFSMVWKPFGILLDLMHGQLSRKHEFEADAYAAQAVGSAAPLMTALKRLTRDHLSHLTPHPWFVALHHSHPPVLARLEALARVPQPG
jgi:STE24 endopeptidase